MSVGTVQATIASSALELADLFNRHKGSFGSNSTFKNDCFAPNVDRRVEVWIDLEADIDMRH